MGYSCSSCSIKGRCTNGWRNSWCLKKGKISVKCHCWCHWTKEDQEELKRILDKENVNYDS